MSAASTETPCRITACFDPPGEAPFVAAAVMCIYLYTYMHATPLKDPGFPAGALMDVCRLWIRIECKVISWSFAESTVMLASWSSCTSTFEHRMCTCGFARKKHRSQERSAVQSNVCLVDVHRLWAHKTSTGLSRHVIHTSFCMAKEHSFAVSTRRSSLRFQ